MSLSREKAGDEKNVGGNLTQESEISKVILHFWANLFFKYQGFQPYVAASMRVPSYLENRDYIVQQLEQANIPVDTINPMAIATLEEWRASLISIPRNIAVVVCHRIVDEFLLTNQELTKIDLTNLCNEVKALSRQQQEMLTDINLHKRGLRYRQLAEFKEWNDTYRYHIALKMLLNEKTGWCKTVEEALKYLAKCSMMEVYFIASHDHSSAQLPKPDTARALFEIAWFAPLYYVAFQRFISDFDLPADLGDEFALQIIKILQQLDSQHKEQLGLYYFADAYHKTYNCYDKKVIPTHLLDLAHHTLATTGKFSLTSDKKTDGAAGNNLSMFSSAEPAGRVLVPSREQVVRDFPEKLKKEWQELGGNIYLVPLVGASAFLTRRKNR